MIKIKNIILNNLKMYDILNKYNIPYNNKKMRCPFHGEDKHPSAAIYETYFHCFSCFRHLDLIGFVEEYFNLSFKEAMQKINIDFGLGLENNKVDYDKLKQIKNIQSEKKKRKQNLINKYCYLCDVKHSYEKIIDCFTRNITIKNWQTLTEIISNFQMKIFKIDEELESLDNLLSSRN